MIFGAGSDLGVNIDGANLGPVQLMNDLKAFYKGESMMFQKDETIQIVEKMNMRLKSSIQTYIRI